MVKPMPPIDVQLRVDISDKPEHTRAAAQHLVEQLSQHFDDAILSRAAFRPGAVYCFRCESAECEHAGPDHPRHVFAGYSQTGLPTWRRLLDVLIEARDARAERLTREGSAAVIVNSTRDELVGARLSEFTRSDRAYDLRGQLAVGYFAMPTGGGDDEPGPERKFALSLQVIRSATRSRAVRLGLNIIGKLPDGRAALEILSTDEPSPFRTFLHAQQREIGRINQELRRTRRDDRMKKSARLAAELLRGMAVGFDRRQRRSGWRTDHANQRAREGKRPTGMARADLESCKDGRVFHDRQDDTFIVLGARGRTHVFATDGRHVTSLVVDAKSVEARLRRRRWEALPADAVAAVRERARDAFERAVHGRSEAAVED